MRKNKFLLLILVVTIGFFAAMDKPLAESNNKGYLDIRNGTSTGGVVGSAAISLYGDKNVGNNGDSAGAAIV